jgi:coenzyme PQQ precursor peptide PqqA
MIIGDENSFHRSVCYELAFPAKGIVADFAARGKARAAEVARTGRRFRAVAPTSKGLLAHPPFGARLIARSRNHRGQLSYGSRIMRWFKPKIVEVAVGLEINSYACAEIA